LFDTWERNNLAKINLQATRGVAKVAVQCSEDIFVVNQSLVLRIIICSKIATFAKPYSLAVTLQSTFNSNSVKKIFLLMMMLATILKVYSQNRVKPLLLPSKFIDGERFYLKIVSVNGDTLLGFCDTGGGFTAIYPNVIEKLNLSSKVKSLKVEESTFNIIAFDEIVKDKRIPKIEKPFYLPVEQSVFVVPDKKYLEGESLVLIKAIPHDVFLGQHFFMGKAWTFDYPKEKVWVNTPILKNKRNRKNIQNLGFKKNTEGRKLFGHPSMKVEIDGDTLAVLFDTGASFILSDSGQAKLGTSQLSIAGSFIAKSIYTKWRSKHPDWNVFEKSDMNADIIEVPEVKIGTYTVGPVLFSVRPDESWSKNMINSMDKVVKGAIGGTVLRYFKIKVDYEKELIEFSKH